MYGGYTEFWFTKMHYELLNDRATLSEQILNKIEELTEQFPEYDMKRVVMETRKHDSSTQSKKGENK